MYLTVAYQHNFLERNLDHIDIPQSIAVLIYDADLTDVIVV